MRSVLWTVFLLSAGAASAAAFAFVLTMTTAPVPDDSAEAPVVLTTGSMRVSVQAGGPASAANAVTMSRAMTIIRQGDRVEIVGAVALIEHGDLLKQAAEQAFPASALDLRLVHQPDVPGGRDRAGLLAISALSRLAEGRAEIVDDTITITGRALYAQFPALLAERLPAQAPAGWTVSLKIEAQPGAAATGGARCRQEIAERLSEDRIGFAVAAAALEPDSGPLIDALAEILARCPEVAVEIAGHTDSDGSEAANRRLSQERAAAVRQALTERGIAAERLSAVGYGQAQPVAPNDTPENKARNRRIELTVIE